MADNNNALQNVPNDGRTTDVTTDELSQFKAELTQISAQANIYQQQRMYDGQTRFNEWDGRSQDGRKHAEDLGKQPPLFEGEPDSQVFLVDTAVRKKAAQLCQSAKRAAVTFQVAGGAMPDFALKLDAMHSWAKRKMGSGLNNEIRKAANWYLDGLPAGVVWFCGWKNDRFMRLRKITMEKAAEFILSTYFQNPTPEDLQTIGNLLTNPEATDGLVDMLAQALPATMDKATIREIVKDLRETGAAEFPEPYDKCNEPILWAMEPFGDVFWPVNTVRDIRNSRVVYIREWLTAAQVSQRALERGWSKEFVQKLIGKPDEQSAATGGGFAGQSGLPIPWGTIYQSQTPLSQQTGLYKDYRHLYEVITAFTQAMNKYGIPGVYTTEFSYFIDEAAGPRKLYTAGHDGMPFVYGQKEIVNNSLTDSRGISVMGATTQTLLKSYTDLHGAAAQMSSIPAFNVGPEVQDGDVAFAPLSLNKLPARSRPEPIVFPEAKANLEAQSIIERRFKDHIGLNGDGIDPNEVATLTQEEIDNFLAPYRDAWVMTMKNMQLFLTPEQVEEICGEVASVPNDEIEQHETPMEQGIAGHDDQYDISGEFHMELSMDAVDFDPQQLLGLTKAVSDYLIPMDADQTINRAALIKWLFNKWNSSMARAVTMPKDAADARENAAADKDLAMMLSGVSVPMNPKGINPSLRLNRIRQRLQLPNIQQRIMAQPDSAQLVDQHLAFLTQQENQQRNREVGKLGVAPDALQQQAEAQ